MRGAEKNRKSVWQRMLASVLIVALFTVMTLKPAPARADTAEAFIYAGIGVAIYVTIIVVATLLIYRAEVPETSAVPLDSLLRDDIRPFPVQTGMRCPQRDGQVTLMCW